MVELSNILVPNVPIVMFCGNRNQHPSDSRYTGTGGFFYRMWCTHLCVLNVAVEVGAKNGRKSVCLDFPAL